MKLTRRQLLALLAGVTGVASIATACRSAIETATTTGPTSPTIPTTTSRAQHVPRTTTTRATTTSTEPGPPPTVPAPETIVVIGREGWSSRPQGEFRTHRIRQITIHHTGVKITDNRNAPARLRRHEDWHMSHGWSDLAYHFMVDRDGNIYEGRPVSAVGDTFTEYDPTGHLLPCFEGDFDHQEPSAAQLKAMTRLVAWAMQEYSVPKSLVRGHRDWAHTTCPGDDMYWRLGGIVRAAIDNRPVALDYLHGDAARERVTRIAAGE